MHKGISKFGKRFLVEPAGTALTDEELRQLERLQPASIMFRKRNFLQDSSYEVWLDAFEKLVKQIKQVLAHERLIFSVDHEGGRVIRPPEPITKFPYAARWADSAAEVGKAMAIELKSLGINVNFAPVADIHSNPDNPVINERAFGRTAAQAASAAVQFAKAMKANGIAPCAKHFPGHGDTKNDSHFSCPVLDLTLDELKQRELVPFQALIDNGVPMVMTAHIVFPKIDPENQATISRILLHDLLRRDMGFSGVVMADALGMHAVVDSIKEQSTITKAAEAGLDIFLVAGDNVTMETAIHMAETMERACERGLISEESIQASEQRIDSFLNNLPQHDVSKLNESVFEQHAQLAEKLNARPAWSDFELNVPGFE